MSAGAINRSVPEPKVQGRFSSWLKFTARIAVLGAFAVLASQCDSGNCGQGEHCECQNGHECFLDCAGGGCDHNCHNMDRCGSVCEHDCTFECQGVAECTSYCSGPNCSTSCHNNTSCTGICGDNCDYQCFGVSSCGVAVGDNSQVTCHDLASCRVDCAGDCRVTCRSIGSECRVTCRDGGGATDCGGGVWACGPC